MIKKTISLVLSVIIALNINLPVLAAESRSISILKVEGSSVTMTKGASKSFTATAGMGLFNGYTVSTGKSSGCQLKMDESSVAKMDANSKIKVVKSSSNLSISVLSGGMSVNAAAQNSGESIRVNAGNSTLAIRGTLFIAEYAPDGEFIITMLTGSGDVDGNILMAGNTMYVYDVVNDKLHEIKDVVIDNSLSTFVLKTILENKDELIENDIFTEGEIAEIPPLLEQKENEPEPQEYVPEQKTEYYGEDTGTSSGGGSSSSGGPTPPTPPTPPPTEVRDLINNAMLGETITITGNSVLSDHAALDAGVTLNIAAGATFDVNSTLELDATSVVNNYGTINNNTSTSIINASDFNNYGKLVNGANGRFVNQYGLRNYGEIIINGGDFILDSHCSGYAIGASITYNAGNLTGSALYNFNDEYHNQVTPLPGTRFVNSGDGSGDWSKALPSDISGIITGAPPIGGTIHVISDTTINNNLTIQSTLEIMVQQGATLTINADVVNYGNFLNYGILNANGTFENYYDFYNGGTVNANTSFVNMNFFRNIGTFNFTGNEFNDEFDTRVGTFENGISNVPGIFNFSGTKFIADQVNNYCGEINFNSGMITFSGSTPGIYNAPALEGVRVSFGSGVIITDISKFWNFYKDASNLVAFDSDLQGNTFVFQDSGLGHASDFAWLKQ